MYTGILHLHHWFAVLLLLSLPVCLVAVFAKVRWAKLIFMTSLVLSHIQFLAGMYLYLFGENGIRLFQNEGFMKNSSMRFYAVEHILTMLLGIILITLAYKRFKANQNTNILIKKVVPFLITAVLLIFSRVPWDRLF